MGMHLNIFHPSVPTEKNPRRDARYIRDKRIRGKNYREAEMKKVSEALAAQAAAVDYFGASAPDALVKMSAMHAAMAKASQVNSPPALIVIDEAHIVDNAFDVIKDATAIAAQIPRRLLDEPTPAEVDIAVGQACAIYRQVQGESTSERKNRIAREKRAIAKAAKNA